MAFMLSTASIAQIKEGKIISKQTFDSEDPAVKGQLAMLGEMKSVTYVKGKNVRTEQSGGMTGTNISISNGETKETLVLMDNPFMGKKYVKTKGDEEEKEENDDFDVEETKETKVILGYTCKKYILSSDDVEISLYVTDKIILPGSEKGMYGGKIKGYPLLTETETSQMGMEMTIKNEVTEIKSEKVDNKKFDMTIPDGYVETTMEQLKGMGGQ